MVWCHTPKVLIKVLIWAGLKEKRHCKCSGIVRRELFLSQLSDNIPKALALEAACVRLLTPSFP